MIGYIYCYKNCFNNKVYIGQTTDLVRRKREHLSKANRGYKEKFYNSIRKYGISNFEFSVICSVESDSSSLSKVLDSLEILYISLYDSYNIGYNSTLGGTSKRGYKLSEDFRNKCKLRTYSEDTRKKMSISASNKTVAEDTKLKHRNNAINRNFAKYRELNIDKLNKNRRLAKIKAVLQYSPDNKLMREWESLLDATNYLHSILPELTIPGIKNGIHRHCSGKTKKNLYHGFIWKYKANV